MNNAKLYRIKVNEINLEPVISAIDALYWKKRIKELSSPCKVIITSEAKPKRTL